MSVVGIDFGSLQSVIAVARNRGIDVITNEVSNRATPSLVSFGPKQRYLGESAKTQEISNFKNTVGSLKRLAGKTFQDREIQEIESHYINSELVDLQGQLGVKVQYLGEKQVFTGTQLIGMYFTKLRDIASNELKIPVSDCVISVPGWFTDVQRRSVLDAADIAGLNCLRLMNDTTAAALGYGITKTDLPEEKPRNVCFVDIGHSSYNVSIVSYLKGQLTVRSTAYDRHFGGRNFDQVLVDFFAEQFKEKYKIDVKGNPKALFRLRAGCERLKKVLSANPQAPLHVESIMNDVDVSSMISRQEFEELAKHSLDRLETPLQQALDAAGMSPADIDAIEMVGGSTRVPVIKDRVSKFFGKDISFTLNQDEAVARGCALQCAILSPVFKVRDFAVHDITPYPIKITWPPTPEEEDTEILVFSKNNSIPSTKILTFYRKEPFDLEAYYAEPDNIPTGINPWIGRFSIKKVEAQGSEPACVKVKARVNLHGILSVENAYIVEEVIKEEKVEEGPAPMDTDEKKEEGSESTPAEAKPTPATKKVKKLVKKADLTVVNATTSLDRSIMQRYKELENEMAATDKLVADTEERKNALEEYVYDMRNKMDIQYREFVSEKDRATFIKLLSETEDWLYGDGEEATKSVYVAKLEELQKYGRPIVERYRESDERPKAEKQLRDALNTFLNNATSNEERYSHIPDEEKIKVVEKCTQVLQWLDSKMEKQNALKKEETPVVYAREILKEREALVLFATTILNKPKPKPAAPEPAPAASGADQQPSADQQPGTPGAQETPDPAHEQLIVSTEEEKNDSKDMDVD